MHDLFIATILRGDGDEAGGGWAGDKATVGQVVSFKILSLSYKHSRLELLGWHVSQVVGPEELMLGIISHVSDFESDSELKEESE